MKFKQHMLILLLCLILSGTRAETVQMTSKASILEEQECDIVLEHGLCLYNGDKLLFADARPEGLAGHWSFDDYKGLDSSGNHNHATSQFKPGPGMGGSGYSAAIGGESFITIPSSPSLNSAVFSTTFWLFLIRDEATQGGKVCPLVYKGNEDADKKQRSPAIMLDRKERTIKVFLTTSANGATTEGETLSSNARLPYNKWSHIAVVRLDKKVRLYVNGILDSVVQTLGSSEPNDHPLYIGGAPFMEECKIPAYIDELRFYNREVTEQEIEAEASPALGNMNPSFVQLGCMNCLITQAAESCIEGYHLCTTIELHSGVYQIARSLGWTSWNSKIWSFSAIKKPLESGENLGLGICCID